MLNASACHCFVFSITKKIYAQSHPVCHLRALPPNSTRTRCVTVLVSERLRVYCECGGDRERERDC